MEKEQGQEVDERQEPVLRRLRFVSGDDPHSGGGVRQVGDWFYLF